MKNDLIDYGSFSENVSHNPPHMPATSAARHKRVVEPHPGELETLDTAANSPDTFRNALRAVKECRAKPPHDFQRLILILAPADRSRAQFAAALAKRNRTVVTTVQTIAHQLHLEDRLRLSSPTQRPVIVIDHGELVTRKTIEFLKSLINLTPVVIVLLATAACYYRWRQSWPVEAGRLHRRTHTVLEHLSSFWTH